MNRNTDFIPFSRPSLSGAEEEAVIRVLRSGWISTGSVAQQFEKQFADYLGAAYALGVNSATAGLHLSLIAAGVKPGSKVVMSPYTFTATAEVCRYLNAHPAFVDIDEETLNIDPVLLEKKLNEKDFFSACIPVHIAGHPCSMDEIMRISEASGIPVIEDAAHAFPVKTESGWIGTMGKTGVFSFYATKPITTGEGGMVVTNDEAYASTIATYRLHGIDRIVWNRYHTKESASWEYDVIAPGYKYNLNDIAAAIGLVQLGKAGEMKQRRTAIAETYLRRFGNLDFIKTPPVVQDHSWHLFILRILPDKLRITRDEFIEELFESGIGTSVHFKPLHLMSYYKKMYHLSPDDFPNALNAFRTSISLPIYHGLSDSQVDYICSAVEKIGNRHYRNR